MKHFIPIILFLFAAFQVQAQVIYAEPAFPTTSSDITVFFDATQGTGGLSDCNCDVYVHTGVITENSNSPSDWKYVQTSWGQANPDWKMTKIEDNLYSYNIGDINDYYGVPEDEEVLQLAFVFRNGDGTLEGKDTGGADIYLDLYTGGLAVQFTEPATNQVFVQDGQSTLEITAEATQTTNFQLFVDDEIVDVANGIIYSYTYNITDTDKHRFRILAINGDNTAEDNFYIVTQTPTEIADLPPNTKDGITYTSDNSATLTLYAPNKEFIYVLGEFNNWEVDPNFQMKRTPDGLRWWVEITDLTAGEEYAYQYLIDGSLKIADPLCELILDPNNDQYITENVFPNLKPYPVEANGIVSVLQPGQTPYEWQTTDFTPVPQKDLVIYELLVRDFVHTHNYSALIDTLDYLENLGINAIELMPVMEFENNLSWGYNPSYKIALDKYYGSKMMFKEFIDECHSRGIAVILDIVLNHHFGQSPLVQMYPLNASPYFNEIPTHDFNVGFDFNHESQATIDYSKRVIEYWMTEYNIDGYRFDLSKGFTQKNTLGNTGAWGQYDQNRIDLWEEYSDFMRDIDPDFYIILEHFAEYSEENELTDYDMMVWSNYNYNYGQMARGFANGVNINDVYYKNRGMSKPHNVAYMESHDEERLMVHCEEDGLSGEANYDIKETEVALERMKLAAAMYFTIPGPKMIWQFGEMGYDYSINFNGRTGPKPIRWDYFEDERRQNVYKVYQALIKLRNENEVFRDGELSFEFSESFRSIVLTHPTMNAHIVANYRTTEKTSDTDFPHTGTWYDYFSGETLEVNDVNMPITLNHGEFKIFTTQALETPEQDLFDLNVYSPLLETQSINLTTSPNPFTDNINISFNLETPSQNGKIEIISTNGKMVAQIFEGTFNNGKNQFNWDGTNNVGQKLSEGVYFIRIMCDDFYTTQKVVFN